MSTSHVATSGSDSADGSEDHPFHTISRAAGLAQPGDTVTVHRGEYREWVRPPRGGLSDQRRITYRAGMGEHVVVKGLERVTGWHRFRCPPGSITVIRCVVPTYEVGNGNNNAPA